MITNNAELAVVKEQLELVEAALESLRREVQPKNQRNFEVLSEGYVEQIDRLREEINHYLMVESQEPAA